MDHGLRTGYADWVRGLRTMFTKTAVLRKVKLRETECGLALNSSPSSLPCTQTFLLPAAQSILCKVSVIWRRKTYCSDKEGYVSTQANWKRKSDFYKKEELEENSIIVLNKISKRHRIKNNSIGVSQSKILIDATISFQIKPWGHEEWRTQTRRWI